MLTLKEGGAIQENLVIIVGTFLWEKFLPNKIVEIFGELGKCFTGESWGQDSPKNTSCRHFRGGGGGAAVELWYVLRDDGSRSFKCRMLPITQEIPNVAR